MTLTSTKPALGRQYVYCPLSGLNFDLDDATLHQVAFMSDPSQSPGPEDWHEAIVVTDGHDLYRADVGDALAILVGPERGDDVDTHDLEAGEYLVWVDVSVAGSAERIVDWSGTLTIVDTP